MSKVSINRHNEPCPRPTPDIEAHPENREVVKLTCACGRFVFTSRGSLPPGTVVPEPVRETAPEQPARVYLTGLACRGCYRPVNRKGTCKRCADVARRERDARKRAA